MKKCFCISLALILTYCIIAFSSLNVSPGGLKLFPSFDGTSTFYSTGVIPLSEYRIQHAIQTIKSDFGVDVLVRPTSFLKFGLNDTIGTSFETIMTLAGSETDETYVSADLITTISSSNAGDAEIMTLEGFTISGTDLTFVNQTVTLDGQNQSTLSTPLARATRLYNDNGTDLIGTIFVYEDGTDTAGVPDADSEVHIMIPAGDNQSHKASTSIASDEYWLITEVTGSVNKKTSATVDFLLQTRLPGKVFRNVFIFSSNSGASVAVISFNPPLIVPANSDIRIRAEASTSNVSVSATMNGYFAQVQ